MAKYYEISAGFQRAKLIEYFEKSYTVYECDIDAHSIDEWRRSTSKAAETFMRRLIKRQAKRRGRPGCHVTNYKY